MDTAAFRAQFPVLAHKTFLDAACVSLAPRAAVDAVTRFAAMAAECPHESATLQHIAMDDARAQARPAAARLIGAWVDEIALVESTTHGLSQIAAALPLEAGDRVLVSELEFLQVALPFVQLARERGIAIDLVPHRNGAIEVADIEARIGARTRVVSISSTQWTSGFRLDLAALSELARRRGVFLVVDAIQQLGAIPIDVRQTPVDVLVSGGHKWLNAPFGAGLLYVSREALGRLRLPLAGYLNVSPPEGGWGEYFQTPSISPVQEHRFVGDARRFEIGGTANYPGAIALAASIDTLNAVGPQRIAEHIRGLTDRLIEGLDRLGIALVSPRDPERRSGIVTFTVGDSPANIALADRLLRRAVLVSVRYTSGVGGVRVSCHAYNDESDVDRLLSELERAR
jgi:selenocysteine lyase/cysteine desulfurase